MTRATCCSRRPGSIPAVIAGRGRRYGLITDASQRFERGVDRRGQERALERATDLICAIAGGAAGPAGIDELPDELPRRTAVPLRASQLQRLLGVARARERSARRACARSACESTAAQPRCLARHAAVVALRHRDRGRSDRRSRALRRTRCDSRSAAARRDVSSKAQRSAQQRAQRAAHAGGARLQRSHHLRIRRSGAAAQALRRASHRCD